MTEVSCRLRCCGKRPHSKRFLTSTWAVSSPAPVTGINLQWTTAHIVPSARKNLTLPSSIARCQTEAKDAPVFLSPHTHTFLTARKSQWPCVPISLSLRLLDGSAGLSGKPLIRTRNSLWRPRFFSELLSCSTLSRPEIDRDKSPACTLKCLCFAMSVWRLMESADVESEVFAGLFGDINFAFDRTLVSSFQL